MRPIDADEFRARYRGIARSWDHLELRDMYGTEREIAPFAQWAAGEPVDPAGLDWWCGIVRELAGAGRALRRVKVVSEPVSRYHRWVHSTQQHIVAAGEPTRWCPRRLLSGLPLPGNDFYLLDDATRDVPALQRRRGGNRLCRVGGPRGGRPLPYRVRRLLAPRDPA
ncbi:hypothetical protein GCM10010123_27810 [Pilimelia anulata]|uniref:DUF6879 domain-containing protein n=1 Tax=Pilimelia anulata TaxID=53371 RepID=A0A8J3B8S8_9ACTN|nr:DUF6879 family protein [Pilimelia anulata]GGJ96276.1 hypothetical protein GCM10010123_27810 [Pilimelia anulata]